MSISFKNFFLRIRASSDGIKLIGTQKEFMTTNSIDQINKKYYGILVLSIMMVQLLLSST